MVQRLLLDRVDAEAARTAVRGQHDLTVPAGAYETETALAFVQLAVTGAQITLHPTVLEPVPVAGGDDGGVRGLRCARHRQRVSPVRSGGWERWSFRHPHCTAIRPSESGNGRRTGP